MLDVTLGNEDQICDSQKMHMSFRKFFCRQIFDLHDLPTHDFMKLLSITVSLNTTGPKSVWFPIEMQHVQNFFFHPEL